MSEAFEEKEAYKRAVLQTLKNIESNTVGLKEVIPLLSKSMDNQEELLNYLKEGLSISASQTKEEAESKWRSLMNKATKLNSDVETIQKLQGFANTILSLFLNN
jgi:ABC-type bacteriocin/lantibiotic exporter with double-glycine peptidase domain